MGWNVPGASRLLTATLGLCTVAGITACNEYPVQLTRSTSAIEFIQPQTANGTAKADILWMIDNSGSMCQEQKLLREGFADFVQILGEVNLDFHIGVTTTHFVDDTVDRGREPVAEPGYLQSTPQPIPGADNTCYYGLNEDGSLNLNDMSPILDSIATAVECTTNPDDYQDLLNPPLSELRCTFDEFNWPEECTGDARLAETYFPPPSAYRPIPKVLRAEDYTDERGELEVDRLSKDFACMSLVGVRGWGFEQGLAAVARAFSPELTGGPDGDPAQYPNAGFLRPDAETGVIFVSDENDCSHDGTLDYQTYCGVSECTYQENLGEAGALLKVSNLRDELLANIAASRGVNSVDPNTEVIMASIHGRESRFTRDRPEPDCQPETANAGDHVPISCASVNGEAYSGHRYAEFISAFERSFPKAPSEDEPMTGLICSDFTPALDKIAELFSPKASGCIDDIYACDGPEAACPSNPYTGEAGTCRPYPVDAGLESSGYYCDTGVQVRMKLPADAEADLTRLETTQYCLEGTIGLPEYPRGCVVDPANYQLSACPGGTSGVIIDWNDEQWFNILSGLEVEARYARLPSER
ncbi:hypothetical protein FRC98_17630 [Lujinxingia vulgaris]|uniref:VWA domain-containing protein n=1 Tax=Lujinxingia vulgaris TaxID=2600176 RepID=A0A5C6XCX9_9DELT|nr:hypothetical protein [Lujinxingia vulgaris]TXD34942.1 hypothetical protein FRC98_17630 [Lujinxingia vulgaris]